MRATGFRHGVMRRPLVMCHDGPIYAYNGWTPDQVTVDVQEQLARAGYYDGPIDGVLGPMTREAIAAYQADNGLAVTSAIDEPTLRHARCSVSSRSTFESRVMCSSCGSLNDQVR